MADLPIFPNGADFNSEKLINLLAGTAPTDGVNLAQLNAAIAGGVIFKGPYNASTNTPDLATPAPGVVLAGYLYVTSVAGTFFGEALEIGDTLISIVDNPSSLADWIIVQDNIDPEAFLLKDITSYTELEPVLDADLHLINRGGDWYKIKQEDISTRDRAEAIEQNNALNTSFIGNGNPTPLLWDGAGGSVFLENFTYSKAGNTGEFTYTNAKATVTKRKRFLYIAVIRYIPQNNNAGFNFYMSINGGINTTSRAPSLKDKKDNIYEVTVMKGTALEVNTKRGIMVERSTGGGNIKVESINWTIIELGNQNG